MAAAAPCTMQRPTSMPQGPNSASTSTSSLRGRVPPAEAAPWCLHSHMGAPRRRHAAPGSLRAVVPYREGPRDLAAQVKELRHVASTAEMEVMVSDPNLSYEHKVDWLARHFALRPLEVSGRLVQVLSIGGRVALTWMVEERLPPGAARKRGAALRDALSALGPVFVKVGQTLATRPDLIGDEAAEYLTQLQEKNSPFPSRDAFEIIRSEFGWEGPIAANHPDARDGGAQPLFAELGEAPIAAASLGQVYRGKLWESGPGSKEIPVAVKVMRPRVARQIARDVHIIRLCLKWLQKYWGTEAELPNISNEVGAGLFRELDYHQEARNIEEFRAAHDFQADFLRIPNTFEQWTRQKVLCMEWVDGRRKHELNDREKLSMVKMGVDCCMAQLLQTGIIHADPHDGNMLLAGKKLCLLDFGLVTKITPEQQEAMASAILHTLGEEWAALVEDMKLMGLLPEVPAIWVDPVTQEQVSPLEKGVWKEMAEQEFTDVFAHSMTKDGSQRSFSQITEQLCDLGMSYRVNLPTWLVLIIRAMMTLDGFAAAMNYNPIEAAYPHAIRRALAPITERGRQALRSAVLTPEGDVRWARLLNLLGNDDALREASAANAARALESTEESISSHDNVVLAEEVTPSNATEDLHMDAAEEAKRVLKELMVSFEGSALRRLIYQANTHSILVQMLARETLAAALKQAGGVLGAVRLAAEQIELQAVSALHQWLHKSKPPAAKTTQDGLPAWRANAVYGVLLRRHASQLLRCGPRGLFCVAGLVFMGVALGLAGSVLALSRSVANGARRLVGRRHKDILLRDAKEQQPQQQQQGGAVMTAASASASATDRPIAALEDLLRPNTSSSSVSNSFLTA